MLDMFRSKGLSSVVMGAVIVATVLIFVIQFNPSAGKKAASLSQTCAATVRGYCIEPKDHKAAYLLLVPVDEHGVRLFGRAKQMHLPEIALDGLVERELLVSEAERIGLTVSEDEVNDTIISGFLRVSIPADRPELEMTLQAPGGRKYVGYYFRDPKTKEFDEKIYKRNLKNLMDRSPVEFREVEQREILAAKMRDLVRAPVRVSEAEALDSYMAEKSYAVMTYVELKPSFVARYGMNWALSGADLQKQIDSWAQKSENAAIIQSTLESRKKEAPVKDGNLRHILVRVGATDSAKAHADALAKITEAYLRLDHGESFADVARDLSDDSSKSKGGSLETDKSDAFPAGFRAAADALKNGEMTHAAIESELGYHIIMRDDSSRLAKDVARELFFKTRLQQTGNDFAAKILADMKAGKSADDAVKNAMASLKPVPFVNVIADKTINHTVAAASKDGGADATVATSGADASVTATAGDAGAPAPIQKQLDPAQDPDRPQALTSSSLRRGGEGLPHVGAEATAKMLDFAFGAKDGQVYGEPLKTDEGGVDLVSLKEHKLATREEFEKDRDTYMQTLLPVRQGEALAMYMKRLLDASKADIKRDESYMAQWTRDAGASPDDEEP
jgi:peptidyl-prolyl cis-trans isomerase D